VKTELMSAIEPVPPGRWAVGVSGGADSVALLLLLADRPDLFLHVVHLDHQTRGLASAADAVFVTELAAKLGLPCTVVQRDQIESGMAPPPSNPSTRYRKLRLELFRRAVKEHDLAGVIVAHHADDQAETILLRLLGGCGPAGLCGMSPRRRVDGLTILRPLLEVRRRKLLDLLLRRGQVWREDASNQSDLYARNRIRKWLAQRPERVEPLLNLGRSCRRLEQWVRRQAPKLGETFAARALANLPPILARESARQWLVRHGSPPGQIDGPALQRLATMAADAATPAVGQFPGGVTVRRRRGVLSAASLPRPSSGLGVPRAPS
jgi:tRNA(Ile)-lysidine synthase